MRVGDALDEHEMKAVFRYVVDTSCLLNKNPKNFKVLKLK